MSMISTFDGGHRVRRIVRTVPAPADAKARSVFADLSDNNGEDAFDARAYASAGHVAITLKATQGTSITDKCWETWTAAAHREHLAVCHYHFCQVSDPIGEARHFWSTVRPHFNPHVDRLVFDLEVGDQADWPSYLTELDRELVRLAGRHAIGYTFLSGLNSRLKLSSRLWWVAAWGSERPSGSTGRLASGAGTLWGWQYASPPYDPAGGPAGAAGIRNRCDMSVMRPVTVKRIQHGARIAWPGR